MHDSLRCLTFALMLGSSTHADDPARVDPVPDAAHPARNAQVLVPSQGAGMNALFFLASGEAPKPTVVLLHGLPGASWSSST